MDILLIGNGFDLAHGLPTTYRDFIKTIYLKRKSDDPSTKAQVEEFCKKNIWFNYFSKRMIKFNHWCDFENDIEYVVKQLEIIKKQLDSSRQIVLEANNFSNALIPFLTSALTYYLNFQMANNSDYSPTTISNDLLYDCDGYTFPIIFDIDIQRSKFKEKAQFYVNGKFISGYVILVCFKMFIKFIYNHLSTFTRCFHNYLLSIENNHIDKIPLIENIFKNPKIKLLNFNYTHTFKKYTDLSTDNVCFIHGELGTKPLNIVLGIDEKDKTIDPLFAQFRKYFQRFQKKCDCKFRKWILSIYSEDNGLNNKSHNLYIIGHSLTISDREILHELITLKKMTTTIYYHSNDSYLNLMQNLAAILGYQKFSELIENDFIKFEKGNFDKKITTVKP